MTQWDFAANLDGLLASVEGGDRGPRSMSEMVQAAATLVQRSRSQDPHGFERWCNENADALVGQQLLIANVHSEKAPSSDLPRTLRDWVAQDPTRGPTEAVAWLKENHPGLLRAWLLSRVEDLVGQEMTKN